MDDNLPPGFRFHPTDEELITYYLARKISDYAFFARAIADVDLNKCEPWDLPGKASMGEKEWYFFSLRDRKYPTGLRTNRATEAGYWKTTGKDKEIFNFGVLVGMKKTLVFYKGRAPKGEKTNWVMHEYRHQTKYPYKPAKEEWVVCRVFKKCTHVKKPQPSSSSLIDSPYNTPSLRELGEEDVSMFNNLVNPSATSSSALQANDNSSYNNKVDMNLYLNWILAREASNPLSLPWQSVALLGSSYPSTAAALTFNGYQHPEVGNVSSLNLFGAESKSSFPSSSSNVAEPAQQQQQQQQPAFDQESMW